MSDTANTSSPEYVFSRNINASIRLNLQQWIWRRSFGYLLHPDIKIPPNAAVADVGCGTGVWLLELSEAIAPKGATFTGFDIDLSQVPAGGASFPKSISLEELDIMQPLPQHLEGKFDIVNLQFFGFILGAGGPRFDLVLANLVKMVKPGGWLQWSEYDRNDPKFVKTYEGSTTAALEESFGGNIEDLRAKAGVWTPQLAENFAAAGLTATAMDQRRTPPHWLGMMQLNFLAAHDELFTGLPEGNAYKERLQANQDALVQDFKSGGFYDVLMVTAVGKKPN